MKNYFIVMAGGVGSRFWPRSREKNPKQLLKINSNNTMIQNTLHRLEGLVDKTDILIITTKLQKHNLIHQVPFIPENNIIAEPFGKNTAPCIGLAAVLIESFHKDAVMSIVCADHIIANVEEFQRVMRLGAEVAYDSKSLVTIGIVPRRPETGYGYIQYIDEKTEENPYFEKGVYAVKTFAEKPNLETAERFIRSGDFLWNSGMFIWRVDVILEHFKKFLPEIYEELMIIKDKILAPDFDYHLDQMYRRIKGISIDYGIMEKAKNVYVLKGDFGWSDLGSWDEVYNISQKDQNKNAIVGKSYLHNTNNTYVYSPNKFVALVDVEDLIIINTDDALLICKRNKSQDVKEVVDYLRRKQITDLL